MNSNAYKILNVIQKLFLHGGVILSEWTTFLVKDTEIAFCSGANLSSILTSQAVVESHLRFDYFQPEETKNWGFYQLIEDSFLDDSLKLKLHELRKYRNKWVHVKDPINDSDLLVRPTYHENELEEFAKKAIRVMLQTLYSNPWI